MFRMAWLGADDSNLVIFTPYPGSELFNQLRDAGKIPKINDDYFDSLILQFDFTIANSYTDHGPGWQLVMQRNIGQLGFYSIRACPKT